MSWGSTSKLSNKSSSLGDLLSSSLSDDMKPFTNRQSFGSEFSDDKDGSTTLLEISRLMLSYSDFFSKEVSGRICIVGGCETQTKPLFCAIEAALQCRTQAITVLTTSTVAMSVRSYSCSLTVLPFLPEQSDSKAEEFMGEVWPLVKDIQTFCIGAGLGQDEVTENAVEKLILEARKADIPIVLCSGVLKLLNKKSELLLPNLQDAPVVVILNEREFETTWDTLHSAGVMSFHEDSKKTQPCPVGNLGAYPIAKDFLVSSYPQAIPLHQTTQVSNALGPNVVVLRTGIIDITVFSMRCFLFGGEKFSNRWSGQDDLLAGLATVFLSLLKRQRRLIRPMIAATSADFVVLLSTREAYSNCQDGVELGASEVAKVIPAVINNIAFDLSSAAIEDSHLLGTLKV